MVIFRDTTFQRLLGSEKHHLCKRDQLAEDESVVNHHGGGGGGQALHLADKDRRLHQYGCQGRLKEELLEEGGGIGDHHQEKGGEVGGHHLAHDHPVFVQLSTKVILLSESFC